MNILLYISFWFVGRVLGADKPNSCKDNTSGEEGICLSEFSCVSIGGLNIGTCTSSVNNICCKNHVSLQAKEYIRKSIQNNPHNTFSSPKSTQEDFSHNTKLRDSKTQLNLVKEKESLASKSSTKQESHDFGNHSHRHPVQTDSTFSIQKSARIDSPYNLQKQVLTGLQPRNQKIGKGIITPDLGCPILQTLDHDLRNPVRIHPTNDLRKPVQTDISFYLQKPVQVDPSHDLRNVVEVSDSHYLRWPAMQESDHNRRQPVHVHATHNLRKPVKTDSTFYLQKPVQIHSTFYLQKHVKTDPSHNLREAVKVSDLHDLQRQSIMQSDHDLRKPVQVHDTIDLRKPVQTDSTFYLQKPVQIDPSHNLRKAVKVADSHDLRWPTVQEPDHDLRNPVVDDDYDHIDDFFKSENAERKLDKIIQEHAKKTSKDGKNKGNYDPIYELLHEDNHIKSNCEHEYWSLNSSTSNNRTRLENWNIKASQQKVLFRDSTEQCGIPYNESSENLDFEKNNSNLGPWMVSVQEYFFGQFKHKCGGSLLNNLWVITAAHCVDLRPKWDFMLKLGTEINRESENYVERLVNKISIHPKYNNINFDNDIAILRMELPVTFQLNVVPICLPDIYENIEKRKAAVFGWKVATRRKMSSGAAQAETVPVLTNKECEVMFSETGVNESIEKNFVCAGTRSVKESCTGDSGGPMAVLDSKGRWSLVGLYSWGKTCKVPNQPEVYISVRSYVNWIEDTIACFEHFINLSSISS